MGRGQRIKGRRGQSEAANILHDRDWIVDQISVGIKSEDLIGTDPDGNKWSIEVKNKKLIDIRAFKAQAVEQANKRKLHWMLMIRLPHHKSVWIVMRKNKRTAMWR